MMRRTLLPAGFLVLLDAPGAEAVPYFARKYIRGSPRVTPDETGWKVGGHLWWLWAFASSQVTVYSIQSGRGFQEAALVLGVEFAQNVFRRTNRGFYSFESSSPAPTASAVRVTATITMRFSRPKKIVTIEERKAL